MKTLLDHMAPSRISTKLSIYVSAFIVVAFTLLQIYNFLIIKSEIKNQINKEQYTKAKFIAKDIKNKIDKRTKFLIALADIIPPDQMQSEDFLTEKIKEHIAFTNFFPQGFAVINPTGKGVIAEYPVIPGRKNLDLSNRKWLINAKNSQHIIISSPFRSEVSDEVLVVIAKALRDKSGRVLGILEAPIFLNRPGFMEYIFDHDYNETSDTLVISRASQIFLASSTPSLVFKSIPERGEVIFYDQVMDGFNGVGDTVNTSGDEMLAAAANISFLNWFVIVRTPVDKVYQTINESLEASIISGVIVSFAVFLAITFFLFFFFNPLKEAAESVREMVLKKQPLKHIEGYKNDEIGDLIVGFNAVIDMVNERRDKLEKSNATLESLSQIDDLTGVFNRRWLDHTLNQLWQVKTRSQEPLTLLLIDIDEFKKFNDTYGHIAGDECLRKVAENIQKSINRPTDFFARYGGEEFVILLEGDLVEGFAVAEKTRQTVNNLQITHSESPYNHVTISLGISSVIPQLNTHSVELVKQADLALYQSKRRGKNRYECYQHKE